MCAGLRLAHARTARRAIVDDERPTFRRRTEPNTEQFPAIRDEFASTLESLRIIRFAQMFVSVLPLLFWHETPPECLDVKTAW